MKEVKKTKHWILRKYPTNYTTMRYWDYGQISPQLYNYEILDSTSQISYQIYNDEILDSGQLSLNFTTMRYWIQVKYLIKSMRY